MKLRFLGTGSAGGIPLFGCTCAACERARQNPAFGRESACVEISVSRRDDGEATRFLIDAGITDIHRRYTADQLQTILLTHYHMDHVQGLFPLRWGNSARIRLIGPDDPHGADDLYKHPGILDLGVKAEAFKSFSIDDIQITPLPLTHSRPTLGYCLEDDSGSIAYLTDTLGLPDETRDWLAAKRPSVMIIDSSYPPTETPRNHNDVHRAVELCTQAGAGRSVLTHISDKLECWLMNHHDDLPTQVEIARDGMVITP